MTREQIEQLTNEFSQKLVDYRRYLHQNPELSFQEEQTAAWIREHLAQWGIPTLPGIRGNSTVGVLDSGVPGPTIAFRADIDALPIEEESEASYRSKVPGVMHACGHDAHTSMILCLAELLASHRDLVRKGKVLFLFQQAEEQMPGGASMLVEDGALKGVDQIYGLHISHFYQTGTIACCSGPQLSATSNFVIKIKGKSGHAAFPHKAIDPIVAGCAIVDELQQLVTKHTDSRDPVIVNVTRFIAGDKTPANVVPNQAELWGTIRCLDNQLFDELRRRVGEIAKAICSLKGCECEYSHDPGYPALINTPAETAIAWKAIEQTGYHPVTAPANMGGEDFANYLLDTPGCFLKLGVASEEKGIVVLPHNGRFQLDEDAMLVGLRVFLATYLEATN